MKKRVNKARAKAEAFRRAKSLRRRKHAQATAQRAAPQIKRAQSNELRQWVFGKNGPELAEVKDE